MTRSKRLIALVAAVMMVGATTVADAHHAVQNQFDVNVTLEKRGVLKKIDWINPHAWFHFGEVDEAGNPVMGPDGLQVTWSIETTGPNGLRRLGLSDRRLFQLGETYSFSGYPDRSYSAEAGTGATLMFAKQIVFPDGRSVSVAVFDDAKV
jgi:hypothetical protein